MHPFLLFLLITFFDSNPAYWDTTRIYSASSGTLRKIAIGNRIKGITDDTFRIATGQSPLTRNAIILTDTSSAPPMKWRSDIPFTGTGNNGIISVAIGDVDGDGINEVIFGQAGGNLKRVKWINGTWNVTEIDSQPGNVYDIAIGDADNNGVTDIIFARHNYVFRSYWTGSLWQTTQIWSGDNSRCQGVAIGDFDSSSTGNEIVAVTYSGKAVRIRWNGSAWENFIMYNSTGNFYDPAIGDFDTCNLGNEIVLGNGSLTTHIGSLIELYGFGNSWQARAIYIPIGTNEAHENLAIGDVLDEHSGLEIVSIGRRGSAADSIRVIYGSGTNWANQIVVGFPQTPSYGIAIGDVNKYRTYNQEIVFARNTLLFEAEQRLPPGPTITNITHNPIIPLFDEIVTVRAKILDSLPIIADSLYFAINSPNNWQSVSHSHLDSFYYYTIPAQDTGTFVFYFIRAKNSINGTSQSPIYSYQIAYEHSIYQIQWTPGPSDTSPDYQKYIHTKGIVTGVFGRYFNIEEEPGGAWRGIHIRRPKLSDTIPNLLVGDSVEVLGRVSELASQTVLNVYYDSGGRVKKVISNRPLPCTTLTTINLITESLEGALVRIDTVRFKMTGLFIANTTYWVYNFAETESIPVFIRAETAIPNESIPVGFLLLTGCVNQYVNNYQIIPRTMDDFNLLSVDFGPIQILIPPDTVNYGDSILPKVIIRNYAMTPVINLSVWLRIGNTYNNERFFPKLAPKSLDTIEFNTWLGNSGWQTITAYTYLHNDTNPSNDTVFDSVYVLPPTELPDVGVITILLFADTIEALDTISPKVVIKNFTATRAINFYVHFKIGTVFIDSTFISNLNPFQLDTVEFGPWIAQPGNYSLVSYTHLLLDPNPNNDTLYGSLFVRSGIGFWQERKSMPSGLGKNIKQGGALVYTKNGTLYGFKGNNTVEFYAYSIEADSWVEKASIPLLSAKPKRVRRGSALTYDPVHNKIYGLKGNNTREFWQYDLAKDTWEYLGLVPSANGKGVKGGAGLVWDNPFIYFMKGSKSTEFYAYDINHKTWLNNLKPVPLMPSNKPMKDGSCMTKAGDFIYCLKGGYNDFYAYSLDSDTWYHKQSLPLYSSSQKKKRVKDGAGLCYDEMRNLIYALKGGNTQEFWAYSPDLDSWFELETIPKGLFNKRVKSGGSITFAFDKVFAIKGNNTRELWCYYPGVTITYSSPLTEEEMSKRTDRNDCSSGVRLSHFFNFRLYNITGRLIKSGEGIITIDVKDLPSGVYILHLIANTEKRGFWKVVLIK